VHSSMEEGLKPSRIKEGMSGAYSYQRPRRLARISRRRSASRALNLEGRGVEGGGRKGWYSCCWELEGGVEVAEMGFGEGLWRSGGWSGRVRLGWGLRKVELKWGLRVLTVAESMVLSGDGEGGREKRREEAS
jgi:hypothetical protein